MPERRLARRDSPRSVRIAAMLAICAAGALLSGCSSYHVSDLPIIGLPEGAPERSSDPPAYPSVHDMPPPRSAARLTEDEQRKLEQELKAAQKRGQAEQAAAAASAAKP